MDSGDEYKIRLTASDSCHNNDSINACLELNNKIKIEKSENVDKANQIRLNEDTLFKFDCIVNEDKITLKLSEIDNLAPFIYIINLDLDGIREKHKVFRACDDLDEVKEHLDKLFQNKKILLSQDKEEEIELKIKVNYISYEDEFQITLERKMTDNKDAMLLKLYEIQKNKEKLIKDCLKYAKSGGDNINEIEKKIKEFKEKEI